MFSIAAGSSSHDTLLLLGIWILVGIVSFLICEKLASYEADSEEEENSESGNVNANNNIDKCKPEPNTKTESSQKHVRIEYYNGILI